MSSNFPIQPDAPARSDALSRPDAPIQSDASTPADAPRSADAPTPAPEEAAPRRHSGHEAIHSEANAQLLQRLKSVEGHVRGIQKMISDDAYCIDVLKQLKAVRGALDRVGEIALETHLATCVQDGLRSDDDGERTRVIAEILEVFSANARR